MLLDGGSLFHVARKDLFEASRLQGVSDDLCCLTSPETSQGEVRAMIPQTFASQDVMGKDVMILRPAVGAE